MSNIIWLQLFFVVFKRMTHTDLNLCLTCWKRGWQWCRRLETGGASLALPSRSGAFLGIQCLQQWSGVCHAGDQSESDSSPSAQTPGLIRGCQRLAPAPASRETLLRSSSLAYNSVWSGAHVTVTEHQNLTDTISCRCVSTERDAGTRLHANFMSLLGCCGRLSGSFNLFDATNMIRDPKSQNLKCSYVFLCINIQYPTNNIINMCKPDISQVILLHVLFIYLDIDLDLYSFIYL